MDYASGQILTGSNEDARVAPASITKVMTSYVVSAELAARQDPPGRQGHDQREGLALRRRRHRRLDELPAAQQRGVAEGSPLRNDHPVRQRRRDRARRAHRRFRGNLCAADEPVRRAARHDRHALRRCERPAESRSLHDRARRRDAVARADPRLSRRIQDLRDQGFRVERDHAAQPQHAAVARFDRRWHQDRAHQRSRLLPGDVGGARRPAPDRGRHGRAEREAARRRQPGAPQLRLPLLRDAQALRRRASRWRRRKSGRARRRRCRSASPTTSSSRCRAAATAISRPASTCPRGSSRRSRRARKSAP